MPVQQIKHNNDGKFYHIAIDIAKEGAQLFDLTPYVKGRVGDNNFGLLIDWYRQGMLMNVNGAYKPIIDGLVGNFSFDKNGNLKMDDDASPVYSVGKPEDCGPAGQVTYYFPEQMFPKEGIFKGYLGLVDDKGNRYSGVDIWFSVLAGNARMGIACDYYISELAKAIKEAEEDLKAGQKEQQQILDEYRQKVTDLINQVNGQAADVQTTLTNLRTTILALEAKAEKDNLFTQAEADDFKQKIQEQLDKALTKVDEKLASIFGKGQNPVALNVYWTNWDDKKRQYTQLSVDQMKTSIDEAANYVQGIVVPLRLENDGNQFHVLGNLADIKQGIDYAVSKGLKLMSVKIHCVATLEQITNYGIDNFFNDYANSVAAACTSLGATSDVKLTILNERWDLVNDEKYADKVVKLINDLKTATKLPVGISFVQQYLGEAQSAVYSACDFIGLNAYPTVTDLKRSVPFSLIASAWRQITPVIQSLVALYHKPIVLSETGIEDNYEALENPANWNPGAQYNSEGEVQYMYFKGLIESGILDYTTEMWIWFGITSSKAQALLRQYMNGVIN
ncbi:glycoside hydrolase family 113 [Limosilactobacillus reuteri]|uniref:glycoside hydrolase family 113 n=1 Tax=Limosilactobacillus reuteri TaxID=1598 RepID=UPI001651EB68|nr:hypothetical protein [Limosilactobacillus reuteri]